MNIRLDTKRFLAAAGIVVAVICSFLFWASSDIDSGVYMTCLCKGPEDRKCVCLTFDDGPDENMTPKILDILKKHNLKGTFFVIGEKAEKNPDLVSRIIDEGHIVGGHSWTHGCCFPLQSSEAIHEELCRTEDVIYQLTGRNIALFRPPFGVTNPLIANAVEKMQYTNIGWSIRSLDTDMNKDREAVFHRIIDRLHNGAIILLHDRCDQADELLELLIASLQENEYDIVSLDEMLDIEPYRNEI